MPLRAHRKRKRTGNFRAQVVGRLALHCKIPVSDIGKTARSPFQRKAFGPYMDAWNYFNYFTEIEEYFWKKRGAHLLVSPLDWAIMETWQKAGIPLEAALAGIDRAFESYQRSRRGAGKPLKSLAYCTDAVLEAAEESQEAAAGKGPKSGKKSASEPFTREEIKAY